MGAVAVGHVHGDIGTTRKVAEICEPLDGDFGSKSFRIRLGLSIASGR